MAGVVRSYKLCMRGELARNEYEAKIAVLRTLLATGVLTLSQLDHFDAELVACLR